MFKTINYNQWPKTVDFKNAIGEVFYMVTKEFKLVPALYGFRKWDNSFHIRINENENYTCDSHREFISVFKTISDFDTFSWHIVLAPRFNISGILSSKRFGLGIDFSKRQIEVSAHAESDLGFIERTHEIIKKKLELKISEKLEKDSYRRKMLDPKIFISRHFDNLSNNVYYTLSSFLMLLGFDVIQGEEYTSDLIPDKVAHKIEQQEILIAIINGERDHDWIISEIGFAKGKNKHLILIKEKNTLFNSTILGQDFEYIKYEETHIEQAFIPLIQEFKSVGIKGIYY